ncbi:tetratricopeptide repeat protein [Sphingomonas sp. 1P06PA]|uniref:tetratricopeptide repeat protein n=1 Tax=Sphingomonas sp. 1P06PA TaxID=554121 RepID=UPI0039A475AB
MISNRPDARVLIACLLLLSAPVLASPAADRLRAARAAIDRGDGVMAEAELDRAVAQGIRPQMLLTLRAEAMLAEDRTIDALRLLDRAPKTGEALRVRGIAASANGDDAVAAAAFAQAARLSPGSARLWTDIAGFRRDAADPAGAEIAIDRALRLAPGHPAALVRKGELVRARYGLAAAVGWFDRALARAPGDVAALLARAATLGELGRTRAMLSDTRAVLAQRPKDPTALYLQATLAARAGQNDLARRLLLRRPAADDLPAALLLSAVVDLRTGNTEQAIGALRRLLADQPLNGRARRLLALAQWRDGDPAAVAATLAPIVESVEADSWALTLAARAQEKLGDRTAAAALLDRVSAPGNMAVPGDPGRLPGLRAAATAAGGEAEPRIALIRALLATGGAQEAILEARALALANPGVTDAWVLVGDALTAGGRPAVAAEAYRRAANLGFSEPVAMRLIAALRRAGRAQAGAAVLATYLAQNPRSVPARRLQADALMVAGNWNGAARVLQGLRATLGPRDVVIANNLAWALFNSRQPRPALALLDAARSMAPASPALAYSAGWMRHALRRPGGIALLEQAANQVPDSQMVQQRLAAARRG